MQEYINKIKEIVCDYHRPLTDESILSWINQFDESDREFLLKEVVNILEKTYLSENKAKLIIKYFIEQSSKTYGFSSERTFLENVTFLKCQDDIKSQTILINILRDFSKISYDVEISINNLEKKYWIYLDDNLSTGGTFEKNIDNILQNYDKEIFINNDKKILNWFFYIHDWGYKNKSFILITKYPYLKGNLLFSYIHLIQNNPKINYYNPSPKFNNAYIKDEGNMRVHNYLNNLALNRNYSMTNREHAFRPSNLPKLETFFSSAEARDRYEKIILNKGLDIIDRTNNSSNSTRPLGFTSPSHQTLGLGSHVFTWRNTSNTCPIVYWWEGNGWHPLLPVQNRGQN